MEKFSPDSTQPGSKKPGDAPPNACTLADRSANTRRYQSQLFIAVLDRLPIFTIVQCPQIRDNLRDYLQRAFTNWGLNLPTVVDLPNVTRLNTFDALARNALALQIPFEYLESDDYNSLFNIRGPQSPGEKLRLPTHLLPTQLQRAVTHHSWLDLLPIPGVRDNILRGIESGEYDEDQLCEAFCCDLLDFGSGTKALLIVWGESWDARGWEFSPEFFRRWGALLRGCPEVLDATNYWRERRGEMKIGYVLN